MADHRTLLTLNRLDSYHLHRQEEGRHFGIITATSDNDSAALARRIDSQIHNAGDLTGQLIRIVRPVS